MTGGARNYNALNDMSVEVSLGGAVDTHVIIEEDVIEENRFRKPPRIARNSGLNQTTDGKRSNFKMKRLGTEDHSSFSVSRKDTFKARK